MPQIAPIFDPDGDSKTRLLFHAAENLQALEENVGQEGFRLKRALLQTRNGSLQIFNQPFQLEGDLEAELWIQPADAVLDPFQTGEPVQAGEGRSFAEMSLSGRFGLSGRGRLPGASLAIDAQAAAHGQIAYRHLLPVSQNQSRRSALARVARTSRPPQLLDLESLAPGEVHQLSAWLKLGFGLQLRTGAMRDIDALIAPFCDLGLALEAHIEFTAEAALGWSLYEEMNLTVGRTAVLHQNPHWARIRIDRQRRNQLSLGAQFAIEARYDLASSVERIYDRALDLIPTRPVIDTFREVNALVDESDWQGLAARLSERATDVLDGYLERTDWRGWLSRSSEVEEFIDISRRTVQAYDQLDKRIQTWWGEVLAGADLGPASPLRQDLERIAQADPETLDLTAWVASGPEGAVELLELFTGQELEELILASETTAARALGRARPIAQSALDFIDHAPAPFIERLRGLSRHSGIAKAVEFLRANAGSQADLEQALSNAVNARIRTVVTRLLDKAWAQVDARDLERVQTWAKRMESLLQTKERWDQRIRQEIQRLRGEVGFSLGLEFERLSERSALVDLEVDPLRGRPRRIVEKALQAGDLQRLLGDLQHLEDGDSGDGSEAQDLFQIREAVFTSRRIRTTRLWTDFFGRSTTGSRKLRETHIHIGPDAKSGHANVRQALFTGAYLRVEEPSDAPANEAGLWLHTRARSRSLDLEAPYETTESSLRLTYSCQDEKTTGDDLRAIDDLLRTLGFRDAQAQTLADDASLLFKPSRLAVELALPSTAIDGFLANLGGKTGRSRWQTDYLNAARRWYQEPRVQTVLPNNGSMRLGAALADLVRDTEFQKAFKAGPREFEEWARHASLTPRGGRPVPLFTGTIGRSWFQPMISLQSLAGQVGPGLKAMKRFRRSYLSDHGPGTDGRALNRLHGRAARRFGRAQARLWPNAMFLWWLVLLRLVRQDPASLNGVRGVAVLRFQNVEEQKAWGRPMIWRLQEGLAARLQGLLTV